MKLIPFVSSVMAAGLLWAAPVQETLRPVELSPSGAPAAADFDAADWAQRLRDPGLEERKQNYEQLLSQASESAAIRAQLRLWAADEERVELAFTAHLMLRELSARGHRPATRGSRSGSPFGLGLGTLEDLMGDLHSMDPFSSWSPGSQSRGFQFELGPDGVKVEIEELKDGETKTQTYEADSLQELLLAQPQLRERIGGGATALPPGGPFFRHGDPFEDFFGRGSERPEPQGRRLLQPLRPSLDYLGIRMRAPVSRARRDSEGSSEEGLLVVEVVPDSLAQAIGIREGDLVISIAGQAVQSAEDVQRALKACSIDERIDVECVDRGGQLRLRSWVPDAKSDAPAGSGSR